MCGQLTRAQAQVLFQCHHRPVHCRWKRLCAGMQIRAAPHLPCARAEPTQPDFLRLCGVLYLARETIQRGAIAFGRAPHDRAQTVRLCKRRQPRTANPLLRGNHDPHVEILRLGEKHVRLPGKGKQQISTFQRHNLTVNQISHPPLQPQQQHQQFMAFRLCVEPSLRCPSPMAQRMSLHDIVSVTHVKFCNQFTKFRKDLGQNTTLA